MPSYKRKNKETQTFSYDTKERMQKYDLIVDAVYEGGAFKPEGYKNDPITRLLAVGNSGGFRPKKDSSYLVLFTDGKEHDWPDSLDMYSGVFTYYGDNREPGKDLNEGRGNILLTKLFNSLNSPLNPRNDIMPIFIFKTAPTLSSQRSVQFLGLAVPGTINNEEPLISIWRQKNGKRFQNYIAKFTILNEPRISRKWIDSLIKGSVINQYTPENYKIWKTSGTYNPLLSQPSGAYSLHNKEEQLPDNKIDNKMLKIIHNHFENDSYGFEFYASEIYQFSDKNVIIDSITPKTQDGGRDAIGRLKIGPENDPIFVEFALEAKCYGENNPVGVKETSRLISRIRNRQYGVIVTTSYIGKQAYQEIKKDGHPIIFINGREIINILKRQGFDEKSLKYHLESKYT